MEVKEREQKKLAGSFNLEGPARSPDSEQSLASKHRTADVLTDRIRTSINTQGIDFDFDFRERELEKTRIIHS